MRNKYKMQLTRLLTYPRISGGPVPPEISNKGVQMLNKKAEVYVQNWNNLVIRDSKKKKQKEKKKHETISNGNKRQADRLW